MLDFGESGWFWLFYGSQKSRSTLHSGHFSNFIHSFNITSRWKPCRIDSGSLSNTDLSVKCVQSRPCQTSQKTNPVIDVFFEIDKEQDWEAAGLNHDHTSARAKQTQHWWCSARYCTEHWSWDGEKTSFSCHSEGQQICFAEFPKLFSRTSTCATKAPVLSRASSAVAVENAVAFLLPN